MRATGCPADGHFIFRGDGVIVGYLDIRKRRPKESCQFSDALCPRNILVR
jgi:hypothetical protein